MKITNEEEYLEYRIGVVSKELSDLNSSYERNQIQIAQINKKISELQATVDEGFEMFSPIAGGERNFNNQEIRNLQMKVYLYADEILEIQKKVKLVKEEAAVLNKLYNKHKKKNNTEDGNNSDLIEKLNECVKYCDTDMFRVKLELNKIIEMLKDG